ncbi:MAG: KpsF/GutQ family sugar-phosphate isomerase [Methylotenera sp.]|uniref:KpsF/GutQ family sugar-phosphate isomerase n=1 Tax=Methylotenera sp. TaxID=2051956 RepID=UPI00271923AD|nr:KpsF/GutQ family sugar-phosphate isomerase [Methylotenera sp.]MDO9204199.1 KpsF/GutQ family sugar-phosphate isomerase [Methylotenera sp.]MDO9393598.1 KpsF/GutQ family sugar-phosphate isomerase [Methylotenera sp.]MDP1523868.1 KpsF/GutQ family sugar-phosphate isomerase [Methylotenera sp.]MDP3308054.1 KpsF/GutQ family sugar-phosphate isomerase [Methylotenera sp.]
MSFTLKAQQSTKTKQPTLQLAREVLLLEANEISALASRLDENFTDAVTLILNCTGRVVVSGMGKSGHIGGKIASTLASTGTPAFFMHPAEASHGDLGMITAGDIVIALSNSGESDEILAIVPPLKRLGASIIAITGNDTSTLAKAADIHLSAHVAKEACPLGLAPTSSTTVALALGDALALCVLDQRDFTAEDFARSHPGGSLGRRLLIHVNDLMRTGENIPQVTLDASLSQGLLEMTRKGLGLTAIVDANKIPIGIFTDGDLRRAFEQNVNVTTSSIADVMHQNPFTIHQDKLAIEAVEIMEQRKINALLVTDGTGVLVGALNMHDLLLAKVV